jgi:NodT family efflux transporter outer membrane factor (OMF) lipoprotein
VINRITSRAAVGQNAAVFTPSCRCLQSLLLMLGLAGCAVGPDFHSPAPPSSTAYAPTPTPTQTASAAIAGGEAQRFSSGTDVPFDWWRGFGSPALDSLVGEALRANPTVPAAQAALRQAQQLVLAQRGYFFPSAAVSYSFQRQKVSGNTASSAAPGVQGNGQTLAPPGPAQPLIFNYQTAQVTVGYTPDVFGGNRRKVESLAAQAQVARFELEATYVTLASNVVAAAIQEASIRAQLAATRQIIDLNEKSLAILRGKSQQGYAARSDVAAQEALLAQARALLPPLQKQFEQTRDLLRALDGRLPDQELPQAFELSTLKLPQDLPLSVPGRLIAQRPDVRAALEQLHAANAEVGVAVAAMLPQFPISGAVGGGANEFPWMFRSGGPFWALIAGASQPLFQGGTLLHARRAADQALAQAAAQYQQSVLTAYQNVADSLHALLSDADELAAALAAERAARVTLDLTQQQLNSGYTDYLSTLTAQITYQQALLNLVSAQATRFGDTAALYQALGGGWWNRQSALTARESDARTPNL